MCFYSVEIEKPRGQAPSDFFIVLLGACPSVTVKLDSSRYMNILE
jgi:hypothetical protein